MVYKINIRKTPVKNIEALRNLIYKKTLPIMEEIEKNDNNGIYEINLNDMGCFLCGSIYIDKIRKRIFRNKKSRIVDLVVNWDDLLMMWDCHTSVLRRSNRTYLLSQEKLNDYTKDFYKWFRIDERGLNGI